MGLVSAIACGCAAPNAAQNAWEAGSDGNPDSSVAAEAGPVVADSSLGDQGAPPDASLGGDAADASLPPRTGGYLGVTCGWQYSAQLTGPLTYPNQSNISLYNPDPTDPDATWDSWAEQLAQAGVDFVCPNLTGSQPNTNSPPSQMAPLLAAFQRRGLDQRIKFGIFDDNAASWCAQSNLAAGRGFGYAQPIDMSDPDNWKYLYDYNYKVFYDTIPDANRFKIDGRPLIIIWTSSGTFLGNAQGNLSKALLYVRQKCMADYGFDPYIIGNRDFLANDTTCAAPGILDATHRWFGPPYDPFTLSTYHSTRVGVGVSEFQHGGNAFLDPNHGELFDMDLSDTVGSGALVTLCEGFTDYEEDAAMFRVRNLDSSGNPLTYAQTLYDYPNQRLDLLRAHSYEPFPESQRFEAEGCDAFGGANGGNGQTDYYRNGDIAIEKTGDVGGGHDVGWMQPGEWLEWEQVPFNGSPHLQVRVSSTASGLKAHVEIDGVAQPAQTMPDTGGEQTWATYDFGVVGSFTRSYHTVRFVFDDGGVNLNWWQTSEGTLALQPPLPVNLALGKSVVVSSTDVAQNPGSNAVDGDTDTEWHSAMDDSAWMYVDLGSSMPVAGVTIRWQYSYGASYKIQVSNDATTWTDAYSTTTGQGHVDRIPLSGVTTRYVKMQGVQAGMVYGVDYGYGIWEFEVSAP